MRELLLAMVPGLMMAVVSCADDLALHPPEPTPAGFAAGHCAACCLVRPDQFGFYATQWRPWPGFLSRSATGPVEALTPVRPPRSVVPGIDDERDHAPKPRPDSQP